jgi:hydrocephalus-inducing protein
MFDSDVFSGEPKLSVAPGTSAVYTVSYSPTSMTQSSDRAGAGGGGGGARGGGAASTSRDAISREDTLPRAHNGSLFIAMPDGSSTVYSLVGYSAPPKPIVLDVDEVPCKVAYRKALPVENWLQQSQRFKVQIKLGSKTDPATELRPALGDTIDVPGGVTRDFLLEFYAHKENTTVQATVTFRSVTTQEFLVYELTLKTTSPGVLDTVQLRTPVRTKAVHRIPLRNPLPSTVTFTMTCVELPLPAAADGESKAARPTPCLEIRGPTQVKVPARSTESYELEFAPLFVAEKQAQLTLSSAELGTSVFVLNLSSTEPAPIPPEGFATPLGGSVTRIIKAINHAPPRGERAKYKVTVSSSAFKPTGLAPGDVVTPSNDNVIKVPIVFEPSSLGTTRAVMTLTSAAGGRYDIPLVGECVVPVPAGPFTVRSGGKVSIPFKNVLDTPCKYSYSVSSGLFALAKREEQWKPKEEKDVVLQYDTPHEGADSAHTGRLLITCTDGPCAGAEWIFYLRGVSA